MAIPHPLEGGLQPSEIFGSTLLQPARNVCVSSDCFLKQKLGSKNNYFIKGLTECINAMCEKRLMLRIEIQASESSCLIWLINIQLMNMYLCWWLPRTVFLTLESIFVTTIIIDDSWPSSRSAACLGFAGRYLQRSCFRISSSCVCVNYSLSSDKHAVTSTICALLKCVHACMLMSRVCIHNFA